MILQRTALYPQMRLDVPDARAIEAFGQNDWKYFLKGIMSSKSQIISGFDITNYQNIFTVPGVRLQCNNVALIHPEAKTQAGGFYVSSGTESDFAVVLNPNTTNFVELDLKGVGGARDVRAFWDPGANGGKGGEYTDTVDTVINLELDVKVNVSGFDSGAISLYKIVTNSQGVVTSLTDCRPMMFRLGAGGTSPDPQNQYSFKNLPDQTHARLETPSTSTSATPTNAPFQGGDKNIRTMKEWMDLVMTQIKQGFALPYWYMQPAASQASAYQNAAMTLMSGGTWEHNGKSSPVTSTTATTVKVQPGVSFAASNGTFKIGTAIYAYSSYSATTGSFSGVSPSATGTAAGSLVIQGNFGHLGLLGGTTLIRLGQANSTLTSFTDIDLTSSNTLFVILSNDGSSVSYGMGQDGASPIIPKEIAARTGNSITVAPGGNYLTSNGILMVRGQQFNYGTYTDATGVFLNVSPDPTGLTQLNDEVYQANSTSGLGYYHHSTTDAVPGTISGISEGVERVYWIAYYDGVNNIILRDTELVPGETVAVGSTHPDELLKYVGSTGPADSFPVYGVGSISDGTNLTAAIMDAFKIIEKPIFDEIVTDTAGTGWANGDNIYLPANSRANNAPGQYTIGSGELVVYENGILMRAGYDYLEIASNAIQLLRDVFMGSYFRFRIANIGGAGAAAGGGSAGLDLQGAYANGKTIVTIAGNPVVIDGPAGQKLFHVKGDVQIDGLLDPTGVELTPQAVNPIPAGKVGMWVDNTSKTMMFTRTDGTVLQAGTILESFGGEVQYFARTKANNSGATIPAGAPVYIATDGSIGLAHADDETAATFFGITMQSIPAGGTGKVIYSGTISGILSGLGLLTGTYLWLASTPGGMSPAPPTNAYAHLRIIGIVDGNDLILQQQHNGQLGSSGA